MIRSKKDLQDVIRQDYIRNMKSDYSFWSYFVRLVYGSDSAKAFRYMKALRHYEYSINCLGDGLLARTIRFYRKWYHHRLSVKYNISIGPNMVGPGFWMSHIVGGGIIINCVSMGRNCGANVNVLIGNRGDQSNRPIIGDNVAFTTGCVVYGKIRIGNNVTVAPNSVVCKDVPDNCVVSGIPAVIIKNKS